MYTYYNIAAPSMATVSLLVYYKFPSLSALLVIFLPDLVQHLIGVPQTCNTVLEIWLPAFECYNLIVLNLLNLLQLILDLNLFAKI